MLNALEARPILTIVYLTAEHRISFPAASSSLQKLMNLGMVAGLTRQQRNRVFVYRRYLNDVNVRGEML